ncbi:MAG: hypothetical protein ACI9GO_001098 [Bacteroidia bacterium]|jgi:hypothetical protein
MQIWLLPFSGVVDMVNILPLSVLMYTLNVPIIAVL